MFHAIVGMETDKAARIASFMRTYPANGSIEVGHINYSPRLQRTRAATESMYLVMKRAFASATAATSGNATLSMGCPGAQRNE